MDYKIDPRKYTGILSGWDKVQPPDLETIKEKGLLTTPELLEKLKIIEQKLSKIEDLQKLLENHIKDKSNPHNYELNVENYCLTYLLYQEYIKKFGFTGTFEDFVLKLYRFLELASEEDLANIEANKEKLATIWIVKKFIEQHENDLDAHKDIVNQVVPTSVPDTEGLKINLLSLYYLNKANKIPIDIGSDNSLTNFYSDTLQPLNSCWNNQQLMFFDSSSLILDLEDLEFHNLTKNDPDPLLASFKFLPDKSFYVLQEDNAESEKYFTANYATPVPSYYHTLILLVKPLFRKYFTIQIDDTITIQYNLFYNTFEIKNNTTSYPVKTTIKTLVNGWRLIKLYFVPNNSSGTIKCHIQQYADSYSYVGNSGGAIALGIFSLYDDYIYGIPFNISLDRVAPKVDLTPVIANIDQGAFYIEFVDNILIPNNYNKPLLTLHLNNTEITKKIKLTCLTDGIKAEYITPDNTYIATITITKLTRLGFSFGPVGAVLGLDEKIKIIGNIDYAVEPYLEAIINEDNVNPYESPDVIAKLTEYPTTNLETLKHPNATLDFLTQYLYPYLKVYKNPSNETVTAIDVWNTAFDPSIVLTKSLNDILPSFTSYILFGTNENKTSYATGMIKSFYYWDKAITVENLKALIGNPYIIEE